MKHLQYFSICEHGQRMSRYVKVTLIELSIPSSLVVWLISPVNLAYLKPLQPVYTVCRHEPRKWHSQVISEAQQFSSLIRQIIHESLVVAVLLHEHFPPLKNWCVYLLSSMSLENLSYLPQCSLFNFHLHGKHVSRSLNHLLC